MRKLSVFNSISVDGYFTDSQGDLSWAHHQDDETDAFTTENARGGGELVFGRVTYEMMVSYWPTPDAHDAMPEVAEQMNKLPKVVFSRTLDRASWDNTELIADDVVPTMEQRKAASGPDMIILGSGTVVSQLTQAGLIDEYQFVVIPVVLGNGRTLFEGVSGSVDLKLMNTRVFRNGNVAMTYQRAARSTG
ncbi:MAG: dihydrofolate reductase family protein [Acidimicrobiia bacterium]